jgi:type II secretory pathway pseudopilin PulG
VVGFHDDRGESLVEILVAVVIMGIAVVAVMGAVLTSVQTSDVHRKQTSAGTSAVGYTEAIDRFVAANDTNYVECATPSSYTPAAVGFAVPSGYTAAVTGIQYWDANSKVFTGTCSSSGLERATVRVASTDGRAAEQSVVVLRRPCGQGSSC